LSPKKIVYLNNLPDSISASNPYVIKDVTPFIEPVILTNDLLAITLQTMEQGTSNTPITSNTAGAFNPLNAFLVDKNGNVELALIGFVKVAGLTTSEAREVIKQRARDYYKEPVVNVKIANFDIRVLGEVNKPGVYNYVTEKISILDVITNAGGLTFQGKHDNILLIRTEGDTKLFTRFSVLTTDIFRHPQFYIKQRDIIYVEPTRFKVESSDNRFLRNVGLISSLISFATLILAFRNFKWN
jgi:polysaccharide export outer membrane protein